MATVTPFEMTSNSLVGHGIHRTAIDGLFFIEANRTDDFRGFYAEVAILPDLEQMIGSAFAVKQINHARSVTRVARGFHAENWNKFVTVVNGSCFCVWVDLRKGSSTFGDAVSLQLGSGSGALYGSVFISKGLGNGYVVTEGPADYVYATDALYRERDPQYDRAISLFDPELAIEWPIPRMDMVLSQRDKQAVTLDQLRSSLG